MLVGIVLSLLGAVMISAVVMATLNEMEAR